MIFKVTIIAGLESISASTGRTRFKISLNPLETVWSFFLSCLFVAGRYNLSIILIFDRARCGLVLRPCCVMSMSCHEWAQKGEFGAWKVELVDSSITQSDPTTAFFLLFIYSCFKYKSSPDRHYSSVEDCNLVALRVAPK